MTSTCLLIAPILRARFDFRAPARFGSCRPPLDVGEVARLLQTERPTRRSEIHAIGDRAPAPDPPRGPRAGAPAFYPIPAEDLLLYRSSCSSSSLNDTSYVRKVEPTSRRNCNLNLSRASPPIELEHYEKNAGCPRFSWRQAFYFAFPLPRAACLENGLPG